MLIQSEILFLLVCFEVSVAQQFLHGVNMQQYVNTAWVIRRSSYAAYVNAGDRVNAV
jgi:hypothetical protein